MFANLSSLERKLWHQWTTTKTTEAANELIKHYMYLVTYHVERIAVHLPMNVNKDDLISLGMVGLYDALKKFDVTRGLKFDTYASFRVRGSIIDGLRKEDWVPRSIRDKMKKIDEATQQLEQELKRKPTVKEIASFVQMTVIEVERVMKDMLFSHVISMDESRTNQNLDHSEGVGSFVSDKKGVEPEEKIIQDELIKELQEALQSLNEKEQLVISLFYHEELTFTEVGKVLDLTTSRISQIHKKAILKLHKTLQKVRAN